MSLDAELYARVRKLEKQVEALLERHPEVRAVMERETAAMEYTGTITSCPITVPVERLENGENFNVYLVMGPDGKLGFAYDVTPDAP
jgi:hypothetical protein